MFTFVSLKKDTSSNIFNIMDKRKKLKDTKNKIFQNDFIKYRLINFNHYFSFNLKIKNI